MVLTPSSWSFLAYSTSWLIRSPFVLTSTWRDPSPFAFRTKSNRSLRIVGSPPENWSAVAGSGLVTRRFSSIPTTCSFVGSYTYPAAAALAKQTGHLRLHLFVTSIIASAVCDLCSGQMPQSRGQFLTVLVRGFSIPSPSYLNFSARTYWS